MREFAKLKDKKAEEAKKGGPPKAPYKTEPDVKGILRSALPCPFIMC